MKILHPTDFSQASEKARLLALDLVTRLGATLHLVHVQQRLDIGGLPYAPVDAANASLVDRIEALREEEARLLRDHLANLTPPGATFGLSWGNPARELLRLAPDFDLIVMGAHGANRFDATILGGVAGRVVRHSPTAVLTVRTEASATQVGRILVATDFGRASERAWCYCQRFARSGVKLVLAHVIDIPQLMGESSYARAVTEAMQEFGDGTPTAERHLLCEGDPVAELPVVAADVGADVIALGVSHHPAIAGMLLGSRADALLRTSPVPILNVPLVVKLAEVE